MSASNHSADGPTTEQEFRDSLGWLIRTAQTNGVDVEGGYAYRSQRRDSPDWGIEIYEVTKRDEAREIS